jgi:hypothetical protein
MRLSTTRFSPPVCRSTLLGWNILYVPLFLPRCPFLPSHPSGRLGELLPDKWAQAQRGVDKPASS